MRPDRLSQRPLTLTIPSSEPIRDQCPGEIGRLKAPLVVDPP